MNENKIDITFSPIKEFLDGVDTVLNSNTFLVQFDATSDNIIEDLKTFLHSEAFINQIADQDKTREWYNLHNFDNNTQDHLIKSGNILNDTFELKINEILNQKSEYLIAMLTADSSKGRFRSFYDTQINNEKDKLIVHNFISFLSTKNDWKLYFIAPNFLKETNKKYSKNQNLRYFQGINGNDTATVILTNNKGFLLLTNGSD